MSKMTTCRWFDHGKAREAAEFYASVFPDSIVPRSLMAGMADPDRAAARRVMEAIVTMIDIARIEVARAGETTDA